MATVCLCRANHTADGDSHAIHQSGCTTGNGEPHIARHGSCGRTSYRQRDILKMALIGDLVDATRCRITAQPFAEGIEAAGDARTCAQPAVALGPLVIIEVEYPAPCRRRQ